MLKWCIIADIANLTTLFGAFISSQDSGDGAGGADRNEKWRPPSYKHRFNRVSLFLRQEDARLEDQVPLEGILQWMSSMHSTWVIFTRCSTDMSQLTKEYLLLLLQC